MSDTPKGMTETILVVDGKEALLKIVVGILERGSFRVLSASSVADAIELAEESNQEIDMLLSDVDMTPMSGPDLGQLLKKKRPALHVMLMSGGNDGNLLVLNYGWAYIQRSLVAKKLVEMVTDVLHSENRSQLGGQEFDSRKDTKNLSWDKSKDAKA